MMKNTKKVKIVVPMKGVSNDEILAMCERAIDSHADIVEWRIDYYEKVKEIDAVVELLKQISAKVRSAGKELIFTCRSEREGGNVKLAASEYMLLNKTAVLSKLVDYIDVEFMLGDTMVNSIVSHAKAHGTKVIISSHDFDSTPRMELIVNRLHKMEEKGADFIKVACMPRNDADVEEMIKAGKEMQQTKDNVILISMGELGKKTRIHPELIGTCMTFGCLKDSASAPGQVEVNELYELLNN